MLLVLALLLPCRAADRVLAPGDPPLTQSIATHFTCSIERIFEAPLTREQWGRVEAAVTEAWRSGNRSDVQGVLDVLQIEAPVVALPIGERPLFRACLQPDLVKRLRGDPDSRWRSTRRRTPPSRPDPRPGRARSATPRRRYSPSC